MDQKKKSDGQISSGFGYLQKRAIRINPDWTEHYVNYDGIKSTLRAFLKRRNYVNSVLKQGFQVNKEDLFLAHIPYTMGENLRSQKHERIIDISWNRSKSIKSKTSKIQPDPDILIELDFNDGDDHSREGSTESDDSSHYIKISDESGKAVHKFTLQDDKYTIQRLYELEKAEISYLLDCEIEKAVKFYNKQIIYVTEYFVTLNINFTRIDHQQGDDEDVYYYLDEVPHDNYVFVGNEMLELLAYAVVNIMALRQILIRYDAFVRSYNGQPLNEWYLKSKSYETCGDYLQDLFNLHPLCTMKNTFSTRLHDLPLQYPNNDQAKETYLYWQRFMATFDKFMSFLDSSLNSMIKTSQGKINFREYITTLLRDHFVLGSQALGLGYNDITLDMKGRKFYKEMKSLAKWQETNEIPIDLLDISDEKINPQNYRSFVLILLSTFLHFMNIYIIKPASTEYVLQLGGNIALTGALIGTMTGASVLSAFIFSFWTNISFILPLLSSSLFMIVGNLLYASAYSFNSFSLMMIGCAMTGIGGPCIINRRFVSVTTPKNLRTAATASFAATSCIGAALGPLLAIMFHKTNDFSVHLFSLVRVDINEMSGPGYLMAILWTVYTVIAAIILREPKRSVCPSLSDANVAILSSLSKSSETPPSNEKQDKTAHDFHQFLDLSATTDENKRQQQYQNFNDLIRFSDDDSDDDTSTLSKHDDSNDSKNDLGKVFLEPQNNTSSVPKFSNPKVCLLLTFFTLFISELVQSSTPIIAYSRYGWGINKISTLSFINLILIVPMSVIVGWLSQSVNDRKIVLIFFPISLFGLLLLIDFTDFGDRNPTISYNYFDDKPIARFVVSPIRYSVGNVIVFTSLQACSSIFASSMSKVLSPRFAKGTYNASFLTTVVGSIGKTCGNLYIITAGFIEIRNLLNLLFVPSFFLVLISIIICCHVKFDQIRQKK